MALLYGAIGKFQTSIIISTKQGSFKILTADKVVSKFLFTTGEYEQDEMAYLIRFLRNKNMLPQKGYGIFLDVGANIGTTSISMLNANEFEKAISIESGPENFSLLKHNVTINKLTEKMKCLQYAVTDKMGEIVFELSPSNFGDHRVRTQNSKKNETGRFKETERKTISVHGDTLDNILESQTSFLRHGSISLVWVDVQGHEGYVYRGARKLFATNVPVISEIWPYGIKQSGMSEEVFCQVASNTWSHFFVPRNCLTQRDPTFVRYPIDTLKYFLQELPGKNDFKNVIFVNDRQHLAS